MFCALVCDASTTSGRESGVVGVAFAVTVPVADLIRDFTRSLGGVYVVVGFLWGLTPRDGGFMSLLSTTAACAR